MDSNSVRDDDSEGEITEEWSPNFRKNRKKDEYIRRILKQCGPDDGNTRPLHVAIIGTHGVGKSAFINTVAAALGGDWWREYAYSGSHGEKGGGITVFTTSFPKCCKSQQYKQQLLPTLVDVAGFDDHDDVGYIELLRILFYGRLPVGDSLADAEQYYHKKGLDGLRNRYREHNETLKVDRVIVLSSATTPAPENLIKCVMDAARPSGLPGQPKRTIPVFGVMLKHDKVVSKSEYEKRMADPTSNQDVVDEPTYSKREKSFISALGLVGSEHRFLRCSNYCDDVDKEKRRVETVIPDIDLPILKFFVQVTDPAMEVINTDETFDDTLQPKEDQPEPEEDEEVLSEPTTQDRKTTLRERKRTPVGERKEITAHERRTPERVSQRSREPNQENIVDNFGENFVSVMMISFEALLVAFIMYFVLKPPFDMGKIRGICKAQAGSPNDQLAEICRDITDGGATYQYIFFLALVALIAVRVVFTMAVVRLYRRQR